MEQRPGGSSRNRVWIVDDERDLAESYADFLSDEFAPRIFTSPEEALHCWDREDSKLDLLVSDLKLAGSDGLSFVQELRGKGMEEPVLMISGYAEKSHILRAQELGVGSFLEKPCNPERLRSKIRSMLAHGSSRYVAERLIEVLLKERSHYQAIVSACVSRYARAENLAAQANAFVPANSEARAEFLRMLYGESRLHRELTRIQEEADQLVSKLESLRLPES